MPIVRIGDWTINLLLVTRVWWKGPDATVYFIDGRELFLSAPQAEELSKALTELADEE
jgi:hypothetical protein